MRIEVRPLGLLAGEAVRDGVRRRIVPAVLVLSFLTLFMADSCASCSSSIEFEDGSASFDVLGYSGAATVAFLGLWSIALAGLLAVDHLRGVFDDGSAVLWLSRPVGKPSLALARLLGSLAVSLGAAILVCGGAALMITTRSDLALAPGAIALVSILLSGVTLAALAMTASLFLPRIVTVLGVLATIGLIAGLNIATLSGRELSGLYFVLDRFGPPLLSGIVLPLAAWSGQVIETVSGVDLALRTVAWAIGSVVLLLAVFDRLEISRLESR